MTERTPKYDPFFLASRREAACIFCVWLVCLLWSISYCYMFGYAQPEQPEQLALVLGVPSWVFFGVALPWLAADVFTIWFSMCVIRDGELDEVEAGQSEAAPPADQASRKGEA